MANNIIKRTWKQGGLVNIEDLRGSAFQAESGGHTFLISGVDENGDALALSGTPAGVLLRADGQDVTLTCSVSDGVVSATLPANAYVVPGRVGITIFLTSDGQKTAIYAAVGSVATTSSGTVAPPAGSDVVDLVNAIATAVATIPASYTDLMAAVAPTYSTSALYAVGSYAWYSGKLYRCTTAITSGETWTSAHWTQANLGSDVSDLKSAFIDYQLGELPMFIVKDSYVKTDGTIASYTGWDRTEYVPVSKYHSMTVKSSVASDYNVFFDANYDKVGNFFGVKTTPKTIDIPSGAVYVIFSNSATGMQNLEVSFKTKAEHDIEDQGANRTNVNSILDGYNILKYELPSDSSVGANWNNTFIKNIPSGTNLTIIFKGYSGSNFSRFAIFGQKLNDEYTEIKTIYSNTETEINIITSEAYKNLYLSLVRSAAESPVSYTVYLKGDFGELLGSDFVKLKTGTENLNDRITMLETEQEQMVYTHFNLFDLCTFDDGYVYSRAGKKVSAEGNSVATPIRVESGKTYYAKNTRCYFSFFIYDDGTNERIGESDSVTYGAFTPSKNGYAYLTTETGNKTSCVFTDDYSLYASSRNATYFLPKKLELGIEGNHVFRVGAGREYTSILECVIAAEQYKNSIVYIDPGTYDMTQEFKDKYGNDYFTSENYLSQTNHRGCPLNNGIHVIGYGGVVVTGGLASTDSQDAIGDWSIFAAGDDTNGDNGYGFTLENITVKSVSQHIRYLIHDEYGATDYNYINKYINCHFIVYPGYVKRCIGGGLGKHGYILIDNCTIDAPAYDATIRGINYHNDAGAGALNEIYIKNCYIPNGTVGITWYGQTPATEKSMLYVNNCYLQAEPVKKAETASAPYENVDIVSWRNTIVP